MEWTARNVDAVQKLAESHHRAALALLGLCLLTYLPGVIRLPVVDRTETFFAESTRGMVERGNWLDPRFGETVHKFRPIGTFWAQAASTTAAGESNARNITVYRLPSLIAVTLAVLALYWLSLPLIGATPALIAAGLFAAAPLTAVVGTLAIADGLALLPATVAMLALLRIYCAQTTDDTRKLSLILWIAVGFGMLVNALHTPILVMTTLIALFAMERDLAWLRRVHLVPGLLLTALIAMPWLYVRTLQDGVPFSGMGLKEFLAALGGAQDMKLRAFPGTFLLAAILGFLPGAALLAPALKRLWDERQSRLPKFLFAWIAGYIVYLELISSKPGTYTVQVMFPAFAIAIALLVQAWEGKLPLPKFHAIPSPLLAAPFALPLIAAPYILMQQTPSLWLLPLAAVITVLFYVSAREGLTGRLQAWAITGIAAVALVTMTMNGAVLPAIDKIWPTRQIERVLAGCPAGPMSVMGFREPAARFILKSDASVATPDAVRSALVESRSTYLVGESRDQSLRALARFQYRRPRPVACVEAYNAMRGCPLYFEILSTGDLSACTAKERFPCTPEFQAKADAAKLDKSCD